MTITVSQLNNYIHGVIDMDGTLSSVSVCGEITNLKRSYNGWYFSLKDDQSAINCFCYEGTAIPEAGAMVIAEGQVNYFTRNGSVSFFTRRITATKNAGAAYLKFVELRDKLQKEGLFDIERKKVVPHCCGKIGIVTSETGAVIHDIETVALRRQPFVNLVLYPVKVQGIGAEHDIVGGIEYFADSDVDVIIVGRGGGSNEDLSVFNAESIVRAIVASPKPVVSAVGHGVDYTLCDFAADKRAATPSEAAEFVTIDCARSKISVLSSLARIENSAASKLRFNCDKVAYLLKGVNAETNLIFERAKNRITEIIKSNDVTVARLIDANEQRMKSSLEKINSLNPLGVLQRGYAYVSNVNGVVKSVDDVNISDEIVLTTYDGKINAKVLSKVKK